MTISEQFPIALQAYQEIQAGFPHTAPSQGVGAKLRSKTDPRRHFDLIPDGSLLLGLAEDGMPLLYNLYDPTQGPLLVMGDGGSGKTSFLQSLARTSEFQNPGEIQFGVLTPFPEEWATQETFPNCLGIWPAYHSAAQTFMAGMVSRAENACKGRQALLVLVDGMDLLAGHGFQVRQSLRWLLMHGPENRVWPVVSFNPGRMNRFETWLDFYQTRVFGQLKRSQTALPLTQGSGVDLGRLLAGHQFYLSGRDGWKKFWLPIN